MPPPSKLLGRAPDELIDLMPALPGMGTDLSDGKRIGAHRRSIDTRNGPRGTRSLKHLSELCHFAFALDFFVFLPFDFSAGIPRWRAYLAMNSSVRSRASESGRWLCGDFIR